jgi:hypothetical protein
VVAVAEQPHRGLGAVGERLVCEDGDIHT